MGSPAENAIAYDQSIERANALMDELQELASLAVENDVMSEEDFRAFDPYRHAETIELIDNTVIDAGRVTDDVLAQANALVQQLTADTLNLRTSIEGEGVSTRNKSIAGTTVVAGLFALGFVGLLAYATRRSR